MSKIPTRCVVDASVGIKLFVSEPLSEQAHRLFESLTENPPSTLYVPDLFFIECTNILWKYSQRFGRSLDDSLADLADLGQLALRVISSADLMEESLILAVQTGLTAYDACYAALARLLDLPLVTVDDQIRQKISWAFWLGSLDS